MSRLIEALGILDHSICGDIECDCCPFENGSECKLRKRVSELPTVDAVEVVRCADCKHQSVYCTTVDCNMRTTHSYFCVLHGTYHEHCWFCADGERRIDE